MREEIRMIESSLDDYASIRVHDLKHTFSHRLGAAGVS